jgi:hypothetical protein
MTEHHDDYLWDPSATPGAEIEALERLLSPFGASARRLAERALPLPHEPQRSFHWRRFFSVAVAAAAAFAGIYIVHAYRLSWPDGSPWPVTMTREDGAMRSTQLRVGERIATSAGETATLSAARIGKVIVAPNSVARLTRTRKGQHRVELEHGRVHARIWAPPNHFGVGHRDASFIDLGCEFDLSIEAGGNGVLVVTSGWVIYRHDGDEILVPEDHSLTFDEGSTQMPTRIDASAVFIAWVLELDRLLTSNATIDPSHVITLSQNIAAGARDEDYFTLLNLLVRHPQLAQGPLYPRLAAALKTNAADELHRARWASGDRSARDEWWRRLPRQPKTWWMNWRDAF